MSAVIVTHPVEQSIEQRKRKNEDYNKNASAKQKMPQINLEAPQTLPLAFFHAVEFSQVWGFMGFPKSSEVNGDPQSSPCVSICFNTKSWSYMTTG